MGKITCSICGMSSFVKQDGVFICSTCGHKYSVDEIQKLLSSNEQSTSKDNCDDVIHDIPNNQAADFFDYQRKYRDYVQWKARKKHLFCCDDTIAGGTEAVALKADGTVLSTILHTKMRENDLPWQAYIINGYSSPIALTSHGSVLITSESTWYDTRISVSDNFCNSNKIKYILQPRCTGCLFALMEDGSVTAEKILTDQGCNYSFDELKSWHNVVEIENFGFSVAAVQSDGIVRVLEPKSISESESIVSFSYGTVGARTTYRDYCHCSFAGERLFDKYAMTDKEQKEALEAGAERIKKEIEARRLAEENAKKEAEMRLLAEEKQKKENEIQQLTEERENISLELANLKGLFTKKRRNELESQLSAVDATISQIQKELAVLQAT